MFDSMGPGLTRTLERQIASILCTKQDEINIMYITSDCFVCFTGSDSVNKSSQLVVACSQ